MKKILKITKKRINIIALIIILISTIFINPIQANNEIDNNIIIESTTTSKASTRGLHPDISEIGGKDLLHKKYVNRSVFRCTRRGCSEWNQCMAI